MMKKVSILAFQLCVLFLVCVLSAMIGFALRRSNGNSGNANRQPLVQQSTEKTIEVKEFPNKPLEVKDISVKEVNILSGQKINVRTLAESGGWLDDLKFTIKNKWNKQIIYIKIDLAFPETFLAAGRPIMIESMDIGNHPQAKLQVRKPLALNPGDIFIHTLTKQSLSEFKKYLEQEGFQLSDLNNAVILINDVFFNDGTVWVQGNWFRHNPNNKTAPGGYEMIHQ